MNLSNVRVAPKLWVTILGLLVVMTLFNLWVFFGAQSAMETSRQDVQRIERKIAMAQFMRGAALRTLEVGAAQLATNEQHLQDAYAARLKSHMAVSVKAMEDMRAALVSDKDKQYFEAIWQAHLDTGALRKRADQEIDPDDFQGRARFALGPYSDQAQKYGEAIDAFVQVQNEQLQALIAKTDEVQIKNESLGWTMTAVLLLIGVLVTRWLVRTITLPLQEAVQLTQSIGAGDLTVKIHSHRKDEFGQLMQSLNTMTQNLREVVLSVRNGVHEVSGAASEIARGNQDLSSRTEQTAANLEETAASIEELTATVNQSADTSRQANQLAVTAVQAAEHGGEVVDQVVVSMEQINTSSRKISDIIGVIDGIAFQTNILALNAAVEAARAGEQGRGFAVVAGEVRTLAQRSAEAAKEIKGLIEASVSNVEAGSAQVAQAGASMQEIVASVRRVTDLIGEITASSNEQRDGFAQVNQAVNNLDQMTQQNAALVEESSAAANAMHDQAIRLRDVVSVFNVGSETAAMGMPRVQAASAAPAAAKPSTVKPSNKTVPQATPKLAKAKPVAPTAKPALAQPAKASTAAKSQAPQQHNADPANDDWETF